MNFDHRFEAYKELIEKELASRFSERGFGFDGLLEAMEYSLLSGGKRIRPILALEFCRISGGSPEDALAPAAALEMLHTYSLIHDDLPCMDNDDLRRCRPTNHKVFGECTAVLAGDALQAEAFGAVLRCGLSAERKVQCAEILAGAAGIDGICGGQYMDMAELDRPMTEEELTDLQARKTGSLLSAACAMGVAAAGGDREKLEAAMAYGACLGAAFQIVDDILDVTGDQGELGKPIGSDSKSDKTTFMSLWGEELCRERAARITQGAKTAIEVFEDRSFLSELADRLLNRRS